MFSEPLLQVISRNGQSDESPATSGTRVSQISRNETHQEGPLVPHEAPGGTRVPQSTTQTRNKESQRDGRPAMSGTRVPLSTIETINQFLVTAAQTPQGFAPPDLVRIISGKRVPAVMEVTAIERRVRVRKTSPLNQNLSPGKRVLEHQLAEVQQRMQITYETFENTLAQQRAELRTEAEEFAAFGESTHTQTNSKLQPPNVATKRRT